MAVIGVSTDASGLGQPRQTENASVFSFCEIHSLVLNGANVETGRAASAAVSSPMRAAGPAFMSNSCG